MFASKTVAARTRPLFTLVALLLVAFTATACIAPDDPMVLTTEDDVTADDAVGEDVVGAPVVEVAPDEEVVVAVEEVDADTLESDELDDEIGDEEGITTEAGLATEIGLSNVLVSSNYFINRDVENLIGDDIADVDDLLIDLNTGRILYVIVNYGDFLDLTDEDRPMPLSAFGWNQELELVLRVPEEVLDTVPAVEDEWPAFNDAAWNDSTLAFWQESDFAAEIDPEAVPVRISELVGLHAGQLGVELGVVEDLLLDLSSEQVAYVGIFTTEGFYSPDLVLLVPLAAANLAVDAVGDDVLYAITLLDIDPEVLVAAPALDRSIFASVDFIDETFTQELSTYWSELGLDVGAGQ